MEAFWITLQIVGGILAPVVLVFTFLLLRDVTNAIIDHIKERRKAALLEEKMQKAKVEFGAVPNPLMMMVFVKYKGELLFSVAFDKSDYEKVESSRKDKPNENNNL